LWTLSKPTRPSSIPKVRTKPLVATLDEVLHPVGSSGAAKADSLTRFIAWQLTQEMQRQGLTKATLAERMHTSRAQLDRILKARGKVTIETLHRAAPLLGRELRLELV